jgi:hypothetical protein
MLSYMLPGITSEEIDNVRLNDPNLKEGNGASTYIHKHSTPN